jgi:hypothetical protein
VAAEETGPAPDESVACALCGTTAPSLPLGWSTGVERGRTVQHCERCSREHVRAMESKLDSEWW